MFFLNDMFGMFVLFASWLVFEEIEIFFESFFFFFKSVYKEGVGRVAGEGNKDIFLAQA